MSKKSRDKGKVGEREVAALIRDYGFTARRGQQFSGGPDSPDVVHSIEGLHIEVKRCEAFRLWDALDQANAEKAGDEAAVVFHRKSRKPWVVVMEADAFLDLLRAFYHTTET